MPAITRINSEASGIWTLRDAEQFKRAGTWPTSPPGGVGAGLQLWLDAADSATLFDATAGGSLVAADGVVARWEDKSGNARHATQGTSGNRPLRKTAIQGGRDVLRFDGSNDFLDGSDTPTTGDTRTVFIVSKSATTAGGEILQIGKWTSAAATRAFLCRQLFISPDTFIGGDLLVTNLVVAGVQLPLTGFHLSTWSQVASTRAVSYWHNQQPQTVTGTVERFASTAPGYFVGKGNTAGTDFGFHQCDIAEIIVYDSALSATNREAVQNYLLAKWAIA